MSIELPKDGTIEAYRAGFNDLDRIWAKLPRACGLSAAEYWSLLMLREGAHTQHEISERLFMSKQTVNSAFRLLVKKGLVRLKPQEGNLRVKQIVFTDAGEWFAMRYIDDMLALEERVWMELPEEERAALTRLTYKFNGMLDAELKKRFE